MSKAHADFHGQRALKSRTFWIQYWLSRSLGPVPSTVRKDVCMLASFRLKLDKLDIVFDASLVPPGQTLRARIPTLRKVLHSGASWVRIGQRPLRQALSAAGVYFHKLLGLM